MNIAIVGSRHFPDYQKVRNFFNSGDIWRTDNLISGGCKLGVDAWVEEAARELKIPMIVLNAEWDKYGKSAGAIRNQKIVDMADLVVAFWDGKSKGTKITIDMTKKAGKPLEVIMP
jgi:uncharacterized phage-like protein YoqJ